MSHFTNKLHHFVLLLGLISLIRLVRPIPIRAEELSSPGFIIKMGTINISSGTRTAPKIKLSDTVGQTAPGQFEKTGYQLSSGFQYSRTQEPFSFKISTDSLSFGTLVPNTLSQREITLSVNAAGVHGYSVSAIEDGVLETADKTAFIPDTTCNPGSKCTPNQAAPWTDSLAYGFGYHLSGDEIDQTQFVDQTYYKPFANNDLGHNPIVIMSKTGRSDQSQAIITFQINTSPTQPNGTYQNAVQFIALPSF